MSTFHDEVHALPSKPKNERAPTDAKDEDAARFTVDTHLFRELGELLVGRDSTALVELIKNAYDADATSVTVYAERLDDPEHGIIIIRDDGLGMTGRQFRKGFLRIASRLKEEGARHSARFRRRFTGAKGIGRLAAHKLARHLKVESVAAKPPRFAPIESVTAEIDWDGIEKLATLDDIGEDQVSFSRRKPNKASRHGTVITLSRLRRHWTERERLLFALEAQSSRTPSLLIEPLPKSLISKPLLFATPLIRSIPSGKDSDRQSAPGESDPGWTLELEGDFEVGEEYWKVVAETTDWILEIDASTGDDVHYAIAPSKSFRKQVPEAVRLPAEYPHSDGMPKFQARILCRLGALRGHAANTTRWASRATGVHVYMEGFRVLPYGETGNDWLSLNRDYAQRFRGMDKDITDLAAQLFDGEVYDSRDEVLRGLPSRNYTGGVFFTQDGASTLQMLVNREGFLPDEAFASVVDAVRRGLYLLTRHRGAVELLADRRKRRQAEGKLGSIARAADSTVVPATRQIAEIRAYTDTLMAEAEEALGSQNYLLANERIASARANLDSQDMPERELRDEQAMIRTLASLGTQMAGYAHEVHGQLALIRTIETTITGLRDSLSGQSSTRDERRAARKLGRVLHTVENLRRGLERQATYLTDIVSVDARRRRSRQRFDQRFDAAYQLLAYESERRDIQVDNRIPDDLKSPPMFRAELMSVFVNLLSNALKAAGQGGRIRVTGARKGDQVVIRVENTGVRVDPDDGEKWFHPFVSTTVDVRPQLGKGVGLGLPITRRILESYGASIRFSQPTARYKTSVEMRFPGQ
ncbi:MAG: ATP-binding protein [Proteobacteria bacterium]|nr:ATP-binding protein [Pseudomonadota bacterium]